MIFRPDTSAGPCQLSSISLSNAALSFSLTHLVNSWVGSGKNCSRWTSKRSRRTSFSARQTSWEEWKEDGKKRAHISRVRIEHGSDRIYTYNIYNAPSESNDPGQGFRNLLATQLISSPSLIAGDFNISDPTLGLTDLSLCEAFLEAIATYDPFFKTSYRPFLQGDPTGDLWPLPRLIGNWTSHRAAVPLPSSGSSTTTLAFSTNTPTAEKDRIEKNDKYRAPFCLCGYPHKCADCYCLVPERRPTGWNARPNTQKKVDIALADVKVVQRV